MNKYIFVISMSAFLAGCAMGINHNVVTVDGKQYIAETPTYVSPILPLTEWSGTTTYMEVDLNPNSIKKIVTPEKTDNVKEIMNTLLLNCSKENPRNSFKTIKCIQREIDDL